MALTIFRALCSSWCAASLSFQLCECLKVFWVCLAVVGCLLRAKNAEFSHFQFLHFFVIFLRFRVPACHGAVSVPTGVRRALFPGSMSIFNAFCQGWIVVARFTACGCRIFDHSRFLIFLGFQCGGLGRCGWCTNWRQESLVSGCARVFNDPSSYYRFRMFWRLPYYVLGLVYSGVFLNFLSSRAVLVLVVTILFHKSGLWSCPIRSIFVPTFFRSNLRYVFSGVDLSFVGCLWR